FGDEVVLHDGPRLMTGADQFAGRAHREAVASDVAKEDLALPADRVLDDVPSHGPPLNEVRKEERVLTGDPSRTLVVAVVVGKTGADGRRCPHHLGRERTSGT